MNQETNINIAPVTEMLLHESDAFNLLVNSANGYLNTITEGAYEEGPELAAHLIATLDFIGMTVDERDITYGLWDLFENYLSDENTPVRVKMVFLTDEGPLTMLIDFDCITIMEKDPCYQATIVAMGFDAPVKIVN